MMQIFVSVPSGRTITLDVEGEDSVSTLRSKIEAKEGLPAPLQRLVFAGRQLEDGQTLAEAAVGREATVHAVLRLLGGRGHGLVGAAFDLEPADVAAHCCAAGAAGGSAAAARPRDVEEDPIRFLEEDALTADNLDALFDLPSMGRSTSMQWDQSDAAWGDLDASVGFFEAKPADDGDASDALSSATPDYCPSPEEEEPVVEPMAVEVAAPAPAPAPAPAKPQRAQRAARAAVVVQASALDIENPKLIQKSHKGLSYNLDEVDDKLRKRLLKNRLSAERSRQRKNAERKNLEEQLDAKNDENQALRSELDRMRALLDKHKIAY